MIRRERDPDLVARIAESVRDSICYHNQPMDWRYACERCVILSNGEDAIGAFEEVAPRQFIGHTIFSPSCRGRRALETAKEMIAFIYPRWADVIHGATPIGNRAARWFNRQIGFKSVGFDDYEIEGRVELFQLGSPM